MHYKRVGSLKIPKWHNDVKLPSHNIGQIYWNCECWNQLSGKKMNMHPSQDLKCKWFLFSIFQVPYALVYFWKFQWMLFVPSIDFMNIMIVAQIYGVMKAHEVKLLSHYQSVITLWKWVCIFLVDCPLIKFFLLTHVNCIFSIYSGGASTLLPMRLKNKNRL